MFGLAKKKTVESVLCAVGSGAAGAVVVCVDSAAAHGKPLVPQWGLHAAQPNEHESLAVTRAVRRLGMAKKPCTTLLDSRHYKLALTDKPNVPPAEREMALLWQAKDLFDLPVEEAVIDVFDFPQGDNIPPEKANSVYVVAARRGEVQRVADEFFLNDLQLEAIDVIEMAQRNLARLLEEEAQGVALLSIDKSRCLITITRGGQLYVARHVDMNTSVFAQDGLAESEFERVSVEVQRSLDYYSTTLRQPPVRAFFVVPTAFEQPALLAFLAANLSVKVRHLDLLNAVSWVNPPTAAQLGSLSLCLGAALRAWSPA